MKRVLALISILLIIAVVVVYQAFIPEQQPPVSPTGHRISHIQADFARYHEAIFSDAEIEIIEARADRVMESFRAHWPEDFLTAMYDEYMLGEIGVDYLLILIASRVLDARSVGDEVYDAVLAELDNTSLNESQAQMLQLIRAKIEYFENR